MEEGTIYQVYYNDEERARHKTLIFVKVENGLIYFINERTNKTEIIPVNNIIRMEGEKENGTKNTQNSQH